MSAEKEALIAEARDPKTPFERLVELRCLPWLKHLWVEVRRALLDNPNVCPTNAEGQLDVSLLENLAEEFPEEVAAHPLFVLHALIEPHEEFEEVVRAVVERTADVGLMERILNTWGPSLGSVRRSMARNQNTTVDTLRLFGNEATEPDWSVRLAVAWNSSTPEDLLRFLGNEQTESEEWVRQAAQKALAERGLT